MSKLKTVDPNDFEIVKEDKKNPKQTKIERKNLTTNFTVAELEDDLINLQRQEREADAQIKLSNAALDNIARSHQFVAKMSDEALKTAAYYHETKEVRDRAEKVLKQTKEAIRKYKQILEVVADKFSIESSHVRKD